MCSNLALKTDGRDLMFQSAPQYYLCFFKTLKADFMTVSLGKGELDCTTFHGNGGISDHAYYPNDGRIQRNVLKESTLALGCGNYCVLSLWSM